MDSGLFSSLKLCQCTIPKWYQMSTIKLFFLEDPRTMTQWGFLDMVAGLSGRYLWVTQNFQIKLESIPWDSSCINVILFLSSQPKMSLERAGDIPFCALKENWQAISQGSANIKGYKPRGRTQTTALQGQVHCVLGETDPHKEKTGSRLRANEV